MGCGHGVNAAQPGGARQEGMAELAGGHFQRASAPPGSRFDIAPSDRDGPTEREGLATDQLFVGVCGLAAQLMIEMGHGKMPAMVGGEAMEQRQQHH